MSRRAGSQALRPWFVGRWPGTAIVPRLSEAPGESAWLGRDLGADTDAVLAAALGYTPQRLDALHARGII
jgi:crotonobetainyl-CoA:carnitine CoA-transferase CaiB-like acyl-CoA transferase